MNRKEYDYLQKLLRKLSQAKETIIFSSNICHIIGIKEYYSEDEKDRFESFTSKFARLSDLIIKNTFKAIDSFELNDPAETIRDAISNAAKKDLISSEFKFIEIRRERNIIAHEYLIDDESLNEIYQYILENYKYLVDSVDRIFDYCKKYKIDDEI